MLKRYFIERDIPGIGAMSETELCGASRASNCALAELAPKVQWLHSYVAADKTFCVYLAEDEASVKRHSEISGIPFSRIFEVPQIIDPVTANH
jgi:Protein of unknown function (DUF4242)